MPVIKIVLVTGTRKPSELVTKVVREVLSERLDPGQSHILIHGGATGADKAAHDYAIEQKWTIWRMNYVKAAGSLGGPIRNEAMVNAALDLKRMLKVQVIAFAFPDSQSSGTWNCVNLLKQKDITPSLHRIDQ